MIFISALDGTLDKVRAFQLGGVDYVPKPFQVEELLARVATHLRLKALERELRQANAELEDRVASRTAEIERLRRRLEIENDALRAEVAEADPAGEILGGSAALGRMMAAIEAVAPTDATVLITGESGTGKELVAREIHRRSRRRDKPMVLSKRPAMAIFIRDSSTLWSKCRCGQGGSPHEFVPLHEAVVQGHESTSMESTSSAGSRSATPSRNGSPGGVIASLPQRPWTHAKCDHRPRPPRARRGDPMRIVVTPTLASSLLTALLVAGCEQGTGADMGDVPEASVPADMSPDAARPLVPPGFETFCAGKDATLTAEVTVGKLGGKYTGYYKNGPNNSPPEAGTLEMMKIVAPAPMWVDKIRVAFASGSGMARLHLENTFGRSYPGSYPSDDTFPGYDPAAVEIIPPVDIDVQGASPDKWIEVDVSAAHGVLLPTFNYMIAYEHLSTPPDPTPYLAIESVPAAEYSRATILYAGGSDIYGVSIDANGTPGNFRLEIVGHAFCQWSADDRWFTDTQPLGGMTLGTSEFADVNGDGHDDLVVTVPRTSDGVLPKVYFGDGAGKFTAAPFEALAAANGSGMMAFADYDNDGDQDVFATIYQQPDGDGDGWVRQTNVGWWPRLGDCNDNDGAIHPGAKETANGKDDNCDGVADEGTAGAGDTGDADKDGFSVQKGDCDDTNAAIFPGAPELLDGLDNDCNGKADDTFHHLMLLNTTAGCMDPSGNCPGGDGHFVVRKGSGIELSEDASEVAVGDTNGDGALDLYWGSWLIHYPDAPAAPSHFYQGDPACKQDKTRCATFTDRMAAVGMKIATSRPVYGVTFNDFNNDGLQDVYVGNYQLNDNLMWQNLGGEMFKNVAGTLMIDHDGIPTIDRAYPGGHSYDSEFGDIDNDGDMDFFLCNLSHPRTQPWADPSQLYINQGAPGFGFVDERQMRGIVYDEGTLNASFGDFDNDMDLDLALGGVYQGHHTIVYRNDGDHFTDVTYQTGALVHQSGTCGWADVDEDGALDLKLHGSDSPQLHLFMNKIGRKNNWVEFTLQGTTTNRDGVGARVTLKAGGVSQMRDVRGSSGGGISADQDSRRVHFGLAQNKTIDSVTVRWVGGKTETFTGTAPNGIYKIVEGTGKVAKIK